MRISNVVGAGVLFVGALGAQTAKVAADPPGEWHNYNRDLGSSRYSPLNQIDRSTVGKLAVAFVWKPDSGVAPREATSSTCCCNRSGKWPLPVLT